MRRTSTFSRNFASRPVRVALAMKIAFVILGANASLAAAKVLWTKAPETPAVARVASTDRLPAKHECRTVDVETDDGYGVRGHVSRTMCRDAL